MVRLKEFTSDTIDKLIRWAQNSDERELLLWAGPAFTYPLTAEQVSSYLEQQKNSILYSIIFEERPVGIIELGEMNLTHKNGRIQKVYVGDMSARGKGVATKALEAVIDLCRDTYRFHKITLGVLAGNRNAYRCYIRLGFEVEGVHRQARLFHDNWYDLIDMALFVDKSKDVDYKRPTFSCETDRLIVRSAIPSDGKAALAYYQKNREFLKTFGPPRPEKFFTLSVQEDMILQDIQWERAKKGLRLWIEKRSEPGVFIGNMSLSQIVRGYFQSAFLGYQLDVDEIRKGYMSEALPVLLRVGFDVFDLHRIEANIMNANQASIATALKLGFSFEGEASAYLFIQDSWKDHCHFSLIRQNQNK